MEQPAPSVPQRLGGSMASQLMRAFRALFGSEPQPEPPPQKGEQPMEEPQPASPGFRSNVEHWKRLQEGGYFETHPCYHGLRDFSGQEDAGVVARFLVPDESMTVAVIGCGYGRETAYLAPRVKRVYGIDVSQLILDKAVRYLGERGIANFTPVLAERYKSDIPAGIDLVYSIVVMQHLTRDLVADYFAGLGEKLSPTGLFVVQFLEDIEPTAIGLDADLRDYEPSVTWTIAQLYELGRKSGLMFKEVRTYQVTPTALWHWACFAKPA